MKKIVRNIMLKTESDIIKSMNNHISKYPNGSEMQKRALIIKDFLLFCRGKASNNIDIEIWRKRAREKFKANS